KSFARDDGVARKYVAMNLRQIWEFTQEAQEKNMSLQTLAKAKSKDAACGISSTSTYRWTAKLLKMYHQRVQMGFMHINHFCIATDGSIHSTKDTLVSFVYAPETDVAAAAPSQLISHAGKVLVPGELDLPPEVEELAAQREVERVPAYRFLQAISNQISQVTQGRLNLMDFRVPESFVPCIEPLRPGDSRQVSEDQDGQVKVVVRRGDIEHQLDCRQAHQWPSLVLCMDQGAIGMAAGAFLIGHGFLCHMSFDKIHRLQRDLALASSRCGKDFCQATMFTSYLWSVNYKPFNSGGFSDEKKTILMSFLASESAEDDELPDPDEISKAFKDLRSEKGGLRLAYLCTSQATWENAHVILSCSRPCWTWHSEQITKIKSPSDNLRYLRPLSLTWKAHWHLQEIAKMIGKCDDAGLTKAAAATEDSARLAAKVFQYSSNLLSQRCLSFSRYSCPPVSYCHVLSEPALAQVAVRQFKQDLDLIHVAEKSREGKAQALAADMRLTFTTLVRVCALTFEQDKWKHKMHKLFGKIMGDGETSVVAVTGMVICHVSDSNPLLCLGNAHWAAMVWPLQAQEDWACIAPAPAGQCRFVHICKCKDWNVIPVNAVWSHGRAMLQRTEVKEPLGQYLLLNKQSSLTVAELCILADSEGVERRALPSRLEILTSLAHHFANGDESYVSSVMAAVTAKVSVDDDEEEDATQALVAELFEMMDASERQEHKSLRESMLKKKVRKKRQQWQKALEEKIRLKRRKLVA
ncbi:unnamed protein product, partial [Effrenium voratum]